MSKCDISISFDRPDRVYCGGETVSGVVSIQVNQDIKCNGITIARYWKTHGIGNRDRGTVQQENLAGKEPLASGQRREFPFSFQADCHPLTYHGQLVNVDHYVKVQVDIPWAIDPKHEEDFILKAGAIPDGTPLAREKKPTFNEKTGRKTSTGAKIVGGIFLLIFIVPLLMLALMLGPFVLIFLFFRFVYRSVVASRIGKVQLETPVLVVAPGEAWPVEMTFTPRTGVVMNGISVRLQCREKAVSGSGSNRTTHRHTVYDSTAELVSAKEFAAGETCYVKSLIPLPDTSAFSFDSSDNDVTWEATVRIDIPRFPDWTKKVELQLYPPEFLAQLPPDTGASLARTIETKTPITTTIEPCVTGSTPPTIPQALPQAVPAAPPRQPEPASAPTPVVPTVSPGARDAAASSANEGLPQAVEKLVEIGPFGEDREHLLAELSAKVYHGVVTVDQMLSTYSSPGDDALTGGQTIVGRLADGNYQVQLFTRPEDNDAVKALAYGDTWQGSIRLHKWDDLYNRPILFAVPS
ncbi:MAG: vacuolar protein sorting-associated family 26 protein [Planctomycetota bacterium]|jgi:hypothetical protein